MSLVVWILGLILVGAVVYVRLAPLDVARWHPLEAEPRAEGDYPGQGRFLAVRAGDETTLAALAKTASLWPRTQQIAGSVAEGQITFETRSRIFAFPDYTTVTLLPGQVQVFARLRFGLDDLGVNKARVIAWLESADAD